MKKGVLLILLSFSILLNCSCSYDELVSTNNDIINDEGEETGDSGERHILSLGDSYTIGTGVCDQCSYPVQLKDSLISNTHSNYNYFQNIVATGGWTTTDFIAALNEENLNPNYDLVTLLIGVNNQYWNRPFGEFQTEFIQLVTTATSLAKGQKSNVIVLSIPDYAYTPFGQDFGNPEEISEEIDQYNAFAKNYCDENGITYIDITDISREGLDYPNLIASDGLHLSEVAYSRITERILPVALEKL